MRSFSVTLLVLLGLGHVSHVLAQSEEVIQSSPNLNPSSMFDVSSPSTSSDVSSSSPSNFVSALLPPSVHGFLQRIRNGNFALSPAEPEVEAKGLKTLAVVGKKKLLGSVLLAKIAAPIVLKTAKVAALASLLPLKLAAKGALLGGLIAKPILIKTALIGGKKAKLGAVVLGKPLLALGGAAVVGTAIKGKIAKPLVAKKVLTGSKLAVVAPSLIAAPKLIAAEKSVAVDASSAVQPAEPEVIASPSVVQHSEQVEEVAAPEPIGAIKARQLNPITSGLAALRRPYPLVNQAYQMF
jgi:hypothetical protein